MRLSRLRVENFRSVRSLDVDLPRLCALVGPNNSGKSNILTAVQRVLGREWINVGSFSDDDVYGRDPDLDIRIVISVDPPIPYARLKNTDPVEIAALSFEYTRYKVGPKRGEPRLEQQCLDAKDKLAMALAKAPHKGEQRQYQPLVGIPNEVRDAVPLIYVGSNRSLKDQLPSARRSLLRQLFEDVNKDLLDANNTVSVPTDEGGTKMGPRGERFKELMSAVMELLRTDEFNRLEESIRGNALRMLGFDPETQREELEFYFSPFDSIDFYKTLDLRVREGNFSISATELGEGFQNALVLAILQAFEERRKAGAILLIEEPEMFLHPQMQRSLYKTLREIAMTNQVIYATHSPHFVSVPYFEEVFLVRRGADGTIVRPSALPVDAKRREKLIKELDPERNELFFAQRLLLVEGDTEKLALPEYAGRLGMDLDRAGATVVEVGGKRNLREFAAIAISFGIPTGIVYDRDSTDFQNDRAEEATFNGQLDGLVRADGSVRVWRLTPDYEGHLKGALGDAKYQEVCQRHGGHSKAVRARLIAQEAELPIPDPIPEVLTWLRGDGRAGPPPPEAAS